MPRFQNPIFTHPGSDPPMHILWRKARNLISRPLFEQGWFLPLLLVLGVSKALIFMVEFRRLAPHLGRPMGVAPWLPLLSPDQECRAHQIGRAVRLAARYTPWDSNCFPQAIAARMLLGLYRVPYALFFGLARDPETQDLKAHAWVASGRIPITGGASFSSFAVVGVFVDARLATP